MLGTDQSFSKDAAFHQELAELDIDHQMELLCISLTFSSES